MMKPNQTLALDAINKRFDSILNMESLTQEEELAIIQLIEDAAGTLMVRGYRRDTMWRASQIQTLSSALLDGRKDAQAKC